MGKTFALISLGCAKNLVNSEQMLYLLDEAGYTLVPDPEGADFCIINTCGFIDAAKSEAIDNILEMAELKKEGKLGGLIVTGCLSQRYQDSILEELPEIDAILGISSFGDIVKAVQGLELGQKPRLFADPDAPVEEIPRVVSTGPSWARDLAAHGVKELIVIAQDITRYGIDLYGHRCLAQLCRELGKIEGVEWIRLHYLYPDQFDEELIDEIARNDKIVKYLDIPIQHINNAILKRMNRKGTGDEIRSLFQTLRERIPGLVLRTSLIAGLPGEGEAEFEELCEFLREAKIERAGVFPFSPEEGTPAAKMAHCDEDEAQRRADLILQLQQPIMDAFCEGFVGKTLRVLVDHYDEDEQRWVGRCYADSPDIDGEVRFEGYAREGEFAQVLITGTEDGILYGEEAEE